MRDIIFELFANMRGLCTLQPDGATPNRQPRSNEVVAEAPHHGSRRVLDPEGGCLARYESFHRFNFDGRKVARPLRLATSVLSDSVQDPLRVLGQGAGCGRHGRDRPVAFLLGYHTHDVAYPLARRNYFLIVPQVKPD